jgi:hypothetical protein
MYRERHAHECETNNRSAMAEPFEEQVEEIISSLELPEDWRDRIATTAVTVDRSCSLPALKDQLKRLARAYGHGAYTEAEYERRKAEARHRRRHGLPYLGLDEAAALLTDLAGLWQEATPSERARLVEPLMERAYVDLASKRMCAITPTPALRLLLERAIQNTSRSDVLLVSNEEAERLDTWRWWRRGRVELPVQRRAGLRSYRRIRRLALVRRASAGPASPDAADES